MDDVCDLAGPEAESPGDGASESGHSLGMLRKLVLVRSQRCEYDVADPPAGPRSGTRAAIWEKG